MGTKIVNKCFVNKLAFPIWCFIQWNWTWAFLKGETSIQKCNNDSQGLFLQEFRACRGTCATIPKGCLKIIDCSCCPLHWDTVRAFAPVTWNCRVVSTEAELDLAELLNVLISARSIQNRSCLESILGLSGPVLRAIVRLSQRYWGFGCLDVTIGPQFGRDNPPVLSPWRACELEVQDRPRTKAISQRDLHDTTKVRKMDKIPLWDIVEKVLGDMGRVSWIGPLQSCHPHCCNVLLLLLAGRITGMSLLIPVKDDWTHPFQQ